MPPIPQDALAAHGREGPFPTVQGAGWRCDRGRGRHRIQRASWQRSGRGLGDARARSGGAGNTDSAGGAAPGIQAKAATGAPGRGTADDGGQLGRRAGNDHRRSVRGHLLAERAAHIPHGAAALRAGRRQPICAKAHRSRRRQPRHVADHRKRENIDGWIESLERTFGLRAIEESSRIVLAATESRPAE